MNNRFFTLPICCAAVLLALNGNATAQTSAAATTSSTSVASKPAAGKTASKLVDSFSSFAGSAENSSALVNGLRHGSPITLTDPAVAGSPAPTPVTFTTPTRPMGYGNVRIALSLARTQLASQGITQPTATQLQGALLGATTGSGASAKTTPGILQMRADGMGWGQIAHSMGFKLGTVMSGKQNIGAATTTSGSSAPTTAAGATAGKGIVNAGGHGKGMTSAAGNNAGKGITTGLGHAPTNAGGVVNAASGHAGAHAGANAGSNAGGLGGGHSGKAVGKP